MCFPSPSIGQLLEQVLPASCAKNTEGGGLLFVFVDGVAVRPLRAEVLQEMPIREPT
jgi:hypothetical protein